MSEVTLRELKTVVERAVRPVRATMARKRRMREELLGHLLAIFEEEAERLGNEQAALEQAKRRFGDPRELTGQLQETVPWWDRIGWFSEKWPFEPGRSAWRLARDTGLFVFGAYIAMVTLYGIPVLLIRRRQSEMGTMLFIVGVLAVVTAGFSFVFTLLLDRMSLALSEWNSGRSVWKLALYILLSIPILPAATFLLYWGLSVDLPTSLPGLRLACCLAPAFPVLLIAMARQVAEERRHDEEWANLEVED